MAALPALNRPGLGSTPSRPTNRADDRRAAVAPHKTKEQWSRRFHCARRTLASAAACPADAGGFDPLRARQFPGCNSLAESRAWNAEAEVRFLPPRPFAHVHRWAGIDGPNVETPSSILGMGSRLSACSLARPKRVPRVHETEGSSPSTLTIGA